MSEGRLGTAQHPAANGRAAKLAGRILLLDDDRIVLQALTNALRANGYDVVPSSSLAAGLRELTRGDFDAVVADLHLPDGDGLETLRAIRERRPGVPVIVVTGYGTVESAVQAMKLGAFDYLTRPIQAERLRDVVRQAVEQHGRETGTLRHSGRADGPIGLHSVIGETYQMRRVFDLIEAVADSTATVLIHGETGTGKSLIARVIHQLSQRRDGPFVEVSCGAIPETLLASELFGHVRGAFTGAVRDKDGKFKAAEGGTILLDEISCASPALQMKLLRVLQEKQFEPVGSNRTVTADVRVVLATNVPLQKEVEAGRFRADLYYRINVVTLELPPLRERLSDIPLLAEHFLRKYTERCRKSIRGFSPEALECMQRYHWPGNVRELENCVERAVVLTRNSQILKSDLPPQVVLAAERGVGLGLSGSRSGSTLKEALAEPERRILLEALEANNWNRSRTAEALGINRATLYKKIKRLGVPLPAQHASTRPGLC